MQPQPLILLTNDDGIESPGLLAAIAAVKDLGELLVVAPTRQWSGAGRSHPPIGNAAIYSIDLPVAGSTVRAYHLDASPAQAVVLALLELATRKPDLCVSGINYGENVGGVTTVSGTVGAALEAASAGIHGIAISVQTAKEEYYRHSNAVDFGAAAHFARLFAQKMLSHKLPPDVDILKIDVPKDASALTSWRITRVSRQRYQIPIIGRRTDLSDQELFDFNISIDRDRLEPVSDIYALAIDRVVSVSPLSIDMTSRVEFSKLKELLD